MKSTRSIKSTLSSGLVLIVVFFLVQGGIVWYATSSAQAVVVESTRKNTRAIKELGALEILAQQIRRYEKEYFIYIGNEEKRDAYEREWRDAHNKIGAALAEMRSGSKGAFTPGDIAKMVAWSDASAFYGSEMNKIFSAVADRAQASVDYLPVEVNGMISEGKNRFSADLIKNVAEMDKTKSVDTLALADAAESIFNNLLAGVLITIVVGILIATILARRLPTFVMKPIKNLSAAAREMSVGNLDKRCDSEGVVEFDELAKALDRLRLGQQMLVERIRKQ